MMQKSFQELLHKNYWFNLLLACLFCSASATAQNLYWAGQFSGNGFKNINGMGIDTSGNIYTAGVFENLVDFDPGPGTYYMSAAGADIFVAKSGNSGTLKWVKKIGSSGFDAAFAMRCDPAGNTYITGNYNGTVDFDPGQGTVNKTAVTDGYFFILKLDSAGNFKWVKTMCPTGEGSVRVASISFDGAGNPVFFSELHGTVDYDAGPGIFSLTALASADLVIHKLSAAGNFLWAKLLPGDGNGGAGVLKIAPNTDICISGAFSQSMDFDPGPGDSLIAAPGTTPVWAYLARYDSAGNFKWAWNIGGGDLTTGSDIAFDKSNNIFLTGHTNNIIDLDPGPGQFNCYVPGALGDVLFVSKYDSAGNFRSAYILGGPGNVEGISVSADSSNNILLAGSFEDSVDMDPGPDTMYLRAAGKSDILLCRLNEDLQFLSASRIGGTGYDFPHAIVRDKRDVVYITGNFESTVDFDPGPGQNILQSLASVYNHDLFIAKFTSSTIAYEFNGNGNWDDPANWAGGQVPPLAIPAGMNITINPIPGGQCILNVAVTVSLASSINVLTNAVFIINGNLTIAH